MLEIFEENMEDPIDHDMYYKHKQFMLKESKILLPLITNYINKL